MWIYEKKLQYPVRVDTTNPTLAAMIIEQFGGADGELSAGLRYLTQRYAMPTSQGKATLNDIGTEECVPRGYQLKRNYLGNFR